MLKKIKYIIPYGKHYFDKPDLEAVIKVLKSPNITQGPTIKILEKKICKFVGCKYAVAVSSATAGLHLASLSLGLDKRKQLLTTPISFVATSNAAFYCGSKPVFCDINHQSLNIDVFEIKKILRKNHKIKIISPVHFGGVPSDMKEIYNLSKKKGIKIVEDAAHALGSRYKDGSMVGNCKYSDLTVFSLHPVKIIAAGEGGIITTNNHNLYKKLIYLRSHGINKCSNEFLMNYSHTRNVLNPWYYEMQSLGYHYRITDIQCGLAISQLNKIKKFIKKRQYLAFRYDNLLKNNRIVTPAQPILPITKKMSACHLYIVRVNFNSLKIDRAELINLLKKKNIITQVHYIPIPMHYYYFSKGYKMNNLKIAKKYYEEALTLPLYYSLTQSEQDYIVKILLDICEKFKKK